MSGLRLAARDWVWDYDFSRGISLTQIAKEHGTTPAYVYVRILAVRRRAREHAGEQEEQLSRPADDPAVRRVIPLFPVGPLTPLSECPHRGNIPPGSRYYCVVCDQTGVIPESPPPIDSSARAASRPRPEPRPRRSGVA